MKKHLLFNQSFGTEGSPNQTGETLTRENRIGLMSYLRRTLMLLFAVLVMSMANISMAWGASPFTIEAPDQITYTQDGITVSGQNTTATVGGSSSQKVYNTTYASVHIFSQSTNITGISFKACYTSSYSGDPKPAITLQTSTGGVFSVLTSSDYSISKDNASPSSISLTNLGVPTNTSSVTYAITFNSPVKAIELTKGTNAAVIRDIEITYNTPSSYTTYYAASIIGSANDDGSVTTGPTGATVTFDHSKSGQATINTKKYDKMEGNQVINLGTGNTFQVGDQIIVDVCSSGNSYSTGGIFDLTGNSDPTISVVTSKTVPALIAYVVVANDGIAGQTSATIGKVETTSYIHGITVLRAASSWKLRGSWNSWEGEGATMTESAGVASISMELSANSRYEFKFKDPSGNQYGNTGAIINNMSGWEYRTDRDNGILYTGPAGNYTFTINTITHIATVTYPTVDHPCSNYVYFIKDDSWNGVKLYNWKDGSSDCVSDWKGSPTVGTTTTICGTTYYYCAAYYNRLIFRDDGTNQTMEFVTTNGQYLDQTETGGAQAWRTFTTYTISFADGGGSGSMAAITGICPGADQELPANTFEKTGYTFAGWKDASSNDYADEATINDISSNITLTAQWSAKNYTIAYDLAGGSVASPNPISYTIESSAITLNNPTKTGYTFSGWTGTGLDAATTTVTIAAGSTGNRSYTATWSSTAPTISGQPSNVSCNVGDVRSISVTASISTGGTPTYQWQVSDDGSTGWANVASSGTSASYTVPTASAGTKYYRCVVTNPNGSAATTSNAATVTVTEAAFVGSTSVNIEQFVLDNEANKNLSGQFTALKSALEAAHISYDLSSGCSIDTLNDEPSDKGVYKVQRNYPYLGLKIKSTGKYVQINLPKGKTLNVKFGNIAAAVKDTINGEAGSGHTSGDYVLDADPSNNRIVKLATSSDGAVVIKQIMIGEAIQSVTLPGKITTSSEGNGTITVPVNGAKVDVGSTVTITTSPSSGYELESLTVTRDTTDNPTVTVTSNQFTMPNGNVTINATFVAAAPTTYTISYECYSATSGCPSEATGQTALPSPLPSAPTKNGYTFGGWYTDDTFETSAVADAALTDNVTLYAKWTAKSYTLTLDKNHSSASAAASTSSVDYDATSFTPTAPTYDGHSVDGYYTSANCTTLVATAAGALQASITVSETVWTNSSSEWKKDGAATFYAHWKCNTPSISCTDNVVTITVPTGSTVYYTTNGSTPTAGSLEYDPSDKPTISANTTIKAIAIQSGCTSSDVASEDCTFTGDCEATTLFSMVVDGSASDYSLTKSTTVTSSDDAVSSRLTSISGGTFSAENTSTSSSKQIFDDNCLRIDSKDIYMTVTLSGGKTLQAGDSITITTATTYHPYITASSSGKDNTEPTMRKSGTSDPYTYTLTIANTSAATGKNLIGLSTFYLWKNSSKAMVHSITITRPCVDATHSISYDKGEGTGTMSGHASIAHNGSQTLTSNSFTAPDNYTFAGWAADVDVTVGGSTVKAGALIANGATITNITSDIALTAKWKQTITLNANTSNHGSGDNTSAVAILNGTVLNSISHTKAASGYKLAGYYTAATSGTKVLNSDGSFVGSAVTGWISDSKWTQNTTSTPTLYAQYESSGALTWNLVVKSDTSALSTSTKTSAFTEIAVANMTNAAIIGGLGYTKSSKSSLTGQIGAPTSLDAAKYVKVTFQVASGYKFTPSSIKVPIQPVSGAADVKLVLVDNAATPDSIGKVQASLSKGSITTVEMTNGSSVEFTGTVTLKIYCYGSSTGTYRLGTPITIEGEIEEACGTMPSYTSMSYTTTTFEPDDDASGSPITIVGGENIDTYQWKYNKVNDRTSGTNCGTGTSLTPLTNEGAATDGTRYYWCEMTNEDCGITIKSPAVAITVASAKSDASVTWTNPASTPNYGGGGYTIKATVEQTGWDGDAADLVITAPAGIRIYNVSSGTDDNSRKYVQADFDVQTSFDRSTYASNIPFTVSAAATATYNAISDEKDVDYSACTGGSASEELMPVNADSVNSTVKGWRFAGTGKMWYGHGSSTPSTGSSNIKSLSNTMADGDIDHYYNSGGSYFSFYTEKAITGVRLYVYTSNSNVKVSNVYIANSQFATGTPSSGAVTYEVVYNDDNEGLDKGDDVYSAWAEITFDSEVAAGKYGLIKLDNNVKIAGIGLISTSGGGATLNTYLQWSGSLADKATVAKNTTDAYFTYSASKITSNTNTLGAITYSSSDPSVAIVDATGKVAMVAAGTTTIKATLAASGCYKKAEISYTLNVTEVACEIAAGTLTLTSGTESKCSGANVTLTLTGFESDASIQWKDGDANINNGGNYTIATDGTTSTLTTNQEGTYSVMVTKDCSVRSNRITISNKSTEVGAKRIVKNWYIKNGRLTPDIELWTLQNGAHLSSVAWSPANTTGLTASDFYESDGKVYLKGKEPSSNTSGKDIDYTLTLTVEDDCGSTTAMSAAGQLIYLHHQKNTDKHVLAFVVSGTDKGGFTEGITAAQTTSVPLYNEIAANFDVLATNIRSTDDEQALKEYYSQFDILCVTDYPNTGDKGVNKKSYVDALGALVDIRPILTMEAWVSKLANWKAKGISGTPKSPTTRQYTMLLQCKDHEIFSGTELTKVGEGDETMYRISMVCDTLEDYKTLDATYGDGAHADKSGYEYASKPALQGFTFDATMADDGLLPLGLIDDGSGNDLQVGIERQTEMEARLMVLGINSYAMERLTDDGQTVVVNALKYLMKKNSEDIADCSNTFVGGDDEEDESTRYDWNVDSHWSGNAIPDRTQKVRIVAPCVIKADEKFHVTGVVIAPIGKYNHGANTANGSLTIAAGGALIVDGKVEAATAPLYTETRATAPADLTIGSTETNGNGTLIFDNEDGSTQAIVEYYSKATTDEASSWSWQYMAVPFNDNSSAYRNYYDSYLYRWAEDCSGWEIVPNRGEVYPWVGYTITQVGEKTYVMDGTLVETGEMEFTVPAGKNLVLGNSWTAPIQVKQFTDDDFENMSKNVYLFNTGYAPNGGGSFSGTRYEGGTYVTIPIHSSTYTGDSLISSLQAFIIYAKADEGGGTFTLDYDRHVRPARSTDKVNAGEMHAPKRGGVINDKPAVLKVWASGSRYDDRLVVLERGDFSTGLDEGWDGNKRVAGNSSPLIFAVTDNGREAVSAIPTMEGTLIGFWAGEDNEYTLHFEYNEEDELYLLDLDNNTYTPVNSNSTYVFTVPDKKAHNRFILTRNAPDPVATGVEETQASEKPEAKAIKFLKDEKVFIFVNGKLYDATGKIVK